MRLVERMTLTPQKCLYCGCGNVEDRDTGETGPFLDLERDINWGDSVYLCMRCVAEIAANCEYIDPTQAKELEAALDAKDAIIHELKAEMDSIARRIRVIEAGSRTLKRVRGKAKVGA